MIMGRTPGFENAFGTLRQLARRDRLRERCELCACSVLPEHHHVVELGKRKLICTCEACCLLFTGPGKKYKRVPRRILAFPNFHVSDAQWESLMVPINMAFFFKSTPDARVVAIYPSPAGPTESLLTLETWNEIENANPVLQQMESDVEALLVNRVGHSREASSAQYYILPIDKCYELVGLIRANWKGLSGGSEAWQEIGTFFTRLRERATIHQEALNA